MEQHRGCDIAVTSLSETATVRGQSEQRNRFSSRPRSAATLSDHEQRARWLHDVVLSEVRLTTLRLEIGDLDGADAIHELVDLDHRLRQRHLDETIVAGGATVGEIVQVHVRRLRGLSIPLSTETLDAVGQLHLATFDAERLHHGLSVLVSNAVNAGATVVGISVALAANRLVAEVTDDAGGFELDQVPVGRALSSMKNSTRFASVYRRPTPTGSIVGAEVELVDSVIGAVPASA